MKHLRVTKRSCREIYIKKVSQIENKSEQEKKKEKGIEENRPREKQI